MKVCAITATAGRHKCMERSLRFFLDQDYAHCVQLIYQNSAFEQRLNINVDKSKVILVNQNIDKETHHAYKTLGGIYRDAIKRIPSDTDVVVFWDDDDIFLPNHITEGVKGMLRGGKKAYKPSRSYYRGSEGVNLVSNTLEPSIFVRFDHIKEHGFHETTSDQHLKWVDALISENELFCDDEGVPTLCYNWGDNFPTFKTSGDPNNPLNFSNYHQHSKDHGDGILTPISRAEADKYYSLFPAK